jgi:molecular chaperone GrpE (heat shock protein)
MNDQNDNEKDERIKQLEAQVASLQAQLRSVRQTLEQYQNYSRRSYQHDYDYLPYEEDRDR